MCSESCRRQPRLQVENNVKLVPVRQNTKQKLDCMQYKAGYIEYQPQEISFIGKNTKVVRVSHTSLQSDEVTFL
jgi:hypothetical protein